MSDFERLVQRNLYVGLLLSYIEQYVESDFDDDGWSSLLEPVIADALGLPEAFRGVRPIVVDNYEEFEDLLDQQVMCASYEQVNAYMDHATIVMEEA